VITRKSDDEELSQLVRLLIIDEVHLLHDDRGPVIEAIIARTLRRVKNYFFNLRKNNNFLRLKFFIKIFELLDFLQLYQIIMM